MKTKLGFFAICSFFLLGQLFYGCQKEETEEYEVNFSFGVSGSTTNSSLKGAFESSIKKANSIILTIMKSDGGSTTYNSTKISIYTKYGFYYSKKILLPPGSYSLTEFLIADSTGNIIYAVPATGSVLANAVENPLPVLFTVSKNQSTLVLMEVISTEGNSCSDFGVLWFPIKEVGVVKVHVAVVDKMTSKLISAELEVFYGSYYSRKFNLEANANNLIVVPDRYEYYNFIVSKDRYHSFVGLISMDSLKKWANYSSSVPLIIELEIQDEGFVTDIDGNVYKTIKIGSQIWMAENLRTTHYNDGTEIPNKYCDNCYLDWIDFVWYNNDVQNKIPYGALYSWYTVISGKLAPAGWHIPSYDEWLTLFDYLGGMEVAGGKLKETGTTHWQYPNIGATNECGFSALPGGYSYHDACEAFSNFGVKGYWWTTTDYIGGSPWCIKISNDADRVDIFYTDPFPGNDYSIRLIKD